MIQLLIELQILRQYTTETLILAINILDRYMLLVSLGHCNIDESNLNVLACACLIIAAKFEQPKKPDIRNMIFALRDLRNETITCKDINLMEQSIII